MLTSFYAFSTNKIVLQMSCSQSLAAPLSFHAPPSSCRSERWPAAQIPLAANRCYKVGPDTTKAETRLHKDRSATYKSISTIAWQKTAPILCMCNNPILDLFPLQRQHSKPPDCLQQKALLFETAGCELSNVRAIVLAPSLKISFTSVAS